MSHNGFDFIVSKLPAIVKSTELGLCLLNKNFEIVWANNVQTRWFGPLKEICGTHCYETFEHNPKICDGCPVAMTFRTGRPSRSGPRTGYMQNGKARFFEISTAPIKDTSGSVSEVLEIVRDITDHKAADDEQAKMARTLSEKNHLFKLLSKRLWQKNKSIRGNALRMQETNEEIRVLNRSLERKVKERTKELELANAELYTLFGLGKKVVSTLNMDEVLDMISTTVPLIMGTDGCYVMLFDESKKYLVLKSLFGLSTAYQNKCKFLKLEERARAILFARTPLASVDISNDPNIYFRSELLGEGIKSLVSVPISFSGEVLGIVTALSRKHRLFLDNEINLMGAFASSAAIAINNARLHENVSLNYYNTINTLSLAVEARDPYTRGHAERVTTYAGGIGKVLNISEGELGILKYSSKIHDIGKIAVSDVVLLKPGKLTPAERAQVELHTIKGVEIISNLKFLEPGIPIIKHHHERYDGTGYPDGLKKEGIPQGARILAVADAFDAMTSARPYRKAFTFEEAVEELRKNAGRQFDPRIVDAFLEILTPKITR